MVASLATMTHSRPDTRPTPVITLAEWTSPPYRPYAASGDSSRNAVPGSIKRSTRWRASILPRDKCRLHETSPPPPATLFSFSRNSATSARMVRALWENSAEPGSIVERSDMAFRVFKLYAATHRAAGIMVSLRYGPAQPQLWVRAG